MSLLTLEDIVKEFDKRVLLDGVGISVSRGERLALTGPNGSGKSTLIKIALKMESYDSGNLVIAKGTRIGYLSQNIIEKNYSNIESSDTALDYEKVNKLEGKLREIEKQMECDTKDKNPIVNAQLLKEYSRLINLYESLDGYTIEAKIKATLLGLGLKSESLNIPVSKLSWGEKMRVAMARLILEEPDLLVLDEPTNHLDIKATEWLEGFLRRFTGGVLLVSHDRYFLDQVATRVAELDNGCITERSGNYTSFITQKEKMKEFAVKEKKRLEREIRYREQQALELKSRSNISAWRSREKMVERLKKELGDNTNAFIQREHLQKIYAPRIAFKNVKHISAEIAKAVGLKKNYGARVLFSDVDFLIRGGERIGIVGSNGCGKTTLLNILLGNDTEYEGYARLGNWVKYAYLGQEISFKNERRTIIQEIMDRKEMIESEAREYISGFQFYGDDVHKEIRVLSGGERVRLYLACLMMLEPDCLIMDEPTNHLDVVAREAVEAAINKFKGTVIAVTHDRYFLVNCVNRILELDEGGMKSYQGNYEFYKKIKAGVEVSNIVPKNDDRLKYNNGSYRRKKTVGSIKENSQINEKVNRESIESEIFMLEEKIKQLEETFGKDTSSEVYLDYESLSGKLNELYLLWGTLEE